MINNMQDFFDALIPTHASFLEDIQLKFQLQSGIVNNTSRSFPQCLHSSGYLRTHHEPPDPASLPYIRRRITRAADM
jgi:hypothetical protein